MRNSLTEEKSSPAGKMGKCVVLFPWDTRVGTEAVRSPEVLYLRRAQGMDEARCGTSASHGTHPNARRKSS